MANIRKAMIVAFFLGIAPAIIININYLIAASEGYVPWCVPYWDSCTSISATGREGTAFYFFKATMLPMAFVYFYYWRVASLTLTEKGYRGKAIVNLGLVNVLALVTYTLALGLAGDNFQLTRRIGIIFYFCSTYINQLLVLNQIYKLHLPDRTRQVQLGLCIIIIGIGFLTLFLDILLDNYDDYEDAFEWIVALLVHINFLIAGFGWRSVIQQSRRKENY